MLTANVYAYMVLMVMNMKCLLVDESQPSAMQDDAFVDLSESHCAVNGPSLASHKGIGYKVDVWTCCCTTCAEEVKHHGDEILGG